MRYRAEIDGLRALAVVPVIFFHGGFSSFRGGFVGVDVFFVISGYLITSIILADLCDGKFSLLKFYERRARRILPALFFVMVSTIPFAYLWMMPDEFKNFGQSLLSTAVFSNNILLAVTSDYWSMTSEFKPFLHTWSLGVEEQYYMLFPLFVMLCWRHLARKTIYVLAALFFVSLVAAAWGVTTAPTTSFYILPTRAWEILMGALAAHHLTFSESVPRAGVVSQTLSLLGVTMLAYSVFVFDNNCLSPGLTTLVPTLGTTLIILFAVKGTILNRILVNGVLVKIGLISYSLYLWHQPLFALARVYSVSKPSSAVILILIALSFVLAYLSWRFLEAPFRNRAAVSRKAIVIFSGLGSLVFVVFGYYLNATYGMAWRAFDSQTRIQDMDKRTYNERVFRYKKDSFSSREKVKLLVIGNSFGRDFINMTLETFDIRNVDILYRDDMSDCIRPYKNSMSKALFNDADIIVIASGYNKNCVVSDVQFAKAHDKKILYVGTKDFGYNLNWIIRLPLDQRRNQYNQLSEDVVLMEREMAWNIPTENYVSLLSPVVKNGRIPITDNSGRILSADRKHVTKYGAIFFGEHSLRGSHYEEILENLIQKAKAGTMYCKPIISSVSVSKGHKETDRGTLHCPHGTIGR